MKTLFILFTCIAFVFPALGCRCIGEQSVKDAVNNSTFVFTGKVLKQRVVKETVSVGEEATGSLMKEYTLLVTKVYKGKATSKRVTVRTGMDSAGCGYEFRKGSSYLVYAYQPAQPQNTGRIQTYTTDTCTRTRLANQASADLKAIKELQ